MSSKDCGFERVVCFSISHQQLWHCQAHLTMGSFTGRAVFAWGPASGDSHHYHWKCCWELGHARPWMFTGLPGLWWPCSILLMAWLPFSGKPDPSKEDSWCVLRFHSKPLAENMYMDKLQLLEFSSSGFCLFKKLSESIKGFSVNDSCINMTFLIAYVNVLFFQSHAQLK